MTLGDFAKWEKASDHTIKWIQLVVAILTLVTLWQSYRLHQLELAEKLEAQS